jgi:hypothetical protein
MASIDAQIDAAVELMKARAAEVCDEHTSLYPLSAPSIDFVLARMHQEAAFAMAHPDDDGFILDTMNLCALALSLLSTETEEGTDG